MRIPILPKLFRHPLKDAQLEEELREIAEQYGITYDKSSLENFVYNIALAGKSFISEMQVVEAKKIVDILLRLGTKTKNPLTFVKAYLLLSEIETIEGKDNTSTLQKALKFAKKLNKNDVIASIYGQLAFDYFVNQEYKKALQIIKKIKVDYDTPYELKLLIAEIKARSLWALDNFREGFNATVEWFMLLSQSFSDIPSLFMSIVYILTVENSLKLPLSEEELTSINNSIVHVLNELASQINLFPQILLNLDLLIAKPLILNGSTILSDFADMLLNHAEWSNQDYFIPFVRKLTELFYNLNEFDKAKEILERGIAFAKHRNYHNIVQQLELLKIEVNSLIFYFQEFDPLLDTHSISEVVLTEPNNQQSIKYLKVIDLPRCSYPVTSYSNFLRVLEKASNTNMETRKFEVVGFPKELQHSLFVLKFEIADQEVTILLKEGYHINHDNSTSLHTTVMPYYAVIGILLDSETSDDICLKELENALLLFQRAMHCPSSKTIIYWPEDSLVSNLCKCWLLDSKFETIKASIFSSALSLKHKYSLLKNSDFLSIFQSDPITIFDFALREPEDLIGLTLLIREAYNINITETKLKELLNDVLSMFLINIQNRSGELLFYKYAWLYYHSKFEEEIEKGNIELAYVFIDKLKHVATKIKEPEKILEVQYIEILTQLMNNQPNIYQKINTLSRNAENNSAKKYQLIGKTLQELVAFSTSPNLKKLYCLLDLLADLWEYRDKKKHKEIAKVIGAKLPQLKLEKLDLSKYSTKNVLYSVLEIIEVLINKEQYEVAFKVSSALYKIITEETIKGEDENIDKSRQIIYLKVKFSLTLYQILKNLGNVLDEAEMFDTIVIELTKYPEWVSDYRLFFEILVEKTRHLISIGEYGIAKKYLHLLEEYVLYELEYLLRHNYLSTLSSVHDLKEQISKEHYT